MVAAVEQPDIEMTLSQACEYAGRKPRCIQYWVQRGLPVARESGRCTYFRRSDIDAFMHSNGYRRFDRGSDQVADAVHETPASSELLEQGGVTVGAATASQSTSTGSATIDIDRAIVGGRVQWAELVKPLMTQVIQLQAKMPTGGDDHGATAKWSESMKKLLQQLQELEQRASENESRISQDDALAMFERVAGEFVQLVQRAEESLVNAIVRELAKHLPIDGVRGIVRTIVSEQTRELMANLAKSCSQREVSDVA